MKLFKLSYDIQFNGGLDNFLWFKIKITEKKKTIHGSPGHFISILKNFKSKNGVLEDHFDLKASKFFRINILEFVFLTLKIRDFDIKNLKVLFSCISVLNFFRKVKFLKFCFQLFSNVIANGLKSRF